MPARSPILSTVRETAPAIRTSSSKRVAPAYSRSLSAKKRRRPRRRYYQVNGSGEKALATSLRRFHGLAIDAAAGELDPAGKKA